MSVAGAAPRPQLAEAGRPRVRAGIPKTLWIGLIIMLICEVLLFTDVTRTGRTAPHTNDELTRILINRPTDAVGRIARFVSVNMTPLVWVGYLIFLEGLL